MVILVIVGVCLVVFGAVVLLWFPDRPGGKVSWQGMEVSSVGAGLPLIVVGLVAVTYATASGHSLGFGASTPSAARAGSSSASGGCLGSVFRGIPVDRVAAVENGANGLVVVRNGESLSRPLGLRLTESGRTIGGVRLTYVPGSQIFRVAAAVDARCVTASDLTDVDRPSQDPRVLDNWDTLRLHLGSHDYDLRIGSSPAIEVTFAQTAA